MQQVLLWRYVPGASEEKPMAQAQGSKIGILNGMMAEWGLKGHGSLPGEERWGVLNAKGSSWLKSQIMEPHERSRYRTGHGGLWMSRKRAWELSLRRWNCWKLWSLGIEAVGQCHSLNPTTAESRAGFKIWGAQCKMKMWGPCSKILWILRCLQQSMKPSTGPCKHWVWVWLHSVMPTKPALAETIRAGVGRRH